MVVQRAVGSCGKELDSFCWPVLAAVAILVHLINFLSILLRCDNGFTGIQKAVVDQTGSRTSVTMTIFWCKFGFGKCFGAFSQSKHWASHCQLYKIHFLSHITIWLRNGLLLCSIREDNTSVWWFFWFAVSWWRSCLLSFFTFSICFKYQTTVEWSTFEFFGDFLCSYERISFSDALSYHCQLPMVGHCPHHQGSHLLCRTSWNTTALYVC